MKYSNRVRSLFSFFFSLTLITGCTKGVSENAFNQEVAYSNPTFSDDGEPPVFDPTPTPVSVSVLDIPVTGNLHSCIRLADGSAKCWGFNSNGQVGNGTASGNGATSTWGSVPSVVKGLKDVVSIAAGTWTSCAALKDGRAQCWGGNYHRTLGNGTTTDSLLPIDVPGLSGVVSVKVGTVQACALLSDGRAKCWGTDHYGSIGDGATTDSNGIPVDVVDLNNAVAIEAGYFNSCAVIADGTLKCWGVSGHAFKNEDAFSSASAVEVPGLSSVVGVSLGIYHSCALISDGTVKCWGYLGQGKYRIDNLIGSKDPVLVDGLKDVIQIVSGNYHNCALISDGSVQCWGTNDSGNLGNGTLEFSATPKPVSGISSAVSLISGGHHTCAVLRDGAVKCWGYNMQGQLGNGVKSSHSATPVTLSGVNVL